MGISKQMTLERLEADEQAQKLWAESVSDDGKAYRCTRCGLWVPDFDFEPDLELCMSCWEKITWD